MVRPCGIVRPAQPRCTLIYPWRIITRGSGMLRASACLSQRAARRLAADSAALPPSPPLPACPPSTPAQLFAAKVMALPPPTARPADLQPRQPQPKPRCERTPRCSSGAHPANDVGLRAGIPSDAKPGRIFPLRCSRAAPREAIAGHRRAICSAAHPWHPPLQIYSEEASQARGLAPQATHAHRRAWVRGQRRCPSGGRCCSVGEAEVAPGWRGRGRVAVAAGASRGGAAAEAAAAVGRWRILDRAGGDSGSDGAQKYAEIT